MASAAWICVTFLLAISSSVADKAPKPRAAPGEKCEDNAPNCQDYVYDDLCHNPAYTDWRWNYCRLTCNLCDQSTPVPAITTTVYVPTKNPSTPYYDPNCHDTISNCHEYQTDMCSNPYFANWAHQHCSLFCAFCHVVTTTPKPTTTETPHPEGLTCFDRLDCEKYDVKTACCGTYEPWARHNCQKFCKFCQPAVPDVRLCTDTDDKCAQYGDNLCTDPSYDRFVREHCAGFCNICDQPEHVPECASNSSVTTAAPGVGTTAPSAVCEDIEDCSSYDIRSACCGAYESWARHHCPKTCKFCYGSVPDLRVCKDVDPLCSQYGDDLCTNPEYYSFVREQCAGTCKICEQPDFIPPCANTTNSIPDGTPAGCTEGSDIHPEGSTWETADCTQQCTCQDAHNNKIVCNPLSCPTPPPHCDAVHVPGYCCDVIHDCQPQ